MRVSGFTYYDLTTVWQIDAPLEPVWEVIHDCEAWPEWWAGAERVDTLERGDVSGVGARQRYVWKSVLPYRLSFVSCVTRVEPMRLMEGRVAGDLEGVGCWRFWQDSSGLTVVRYDWQVRTMRGWMNALAPLAKPIFRWNHDALMRAGGTGLVRRLQGCNGTSRSAPSSGRIGAA